MNEWMRQIVKKKSYSVKKIVKNKPHFRSSWMKPSRGEVNESILGIYQLNKITVFY